MYDSEATAPTTGLLVSILLDYPVLLLYLSPRYVRMLRPEEST